MASIVLAMIVLAHLPFGLMAASLVLAFRTTGPLPTAILTVSGLLGGVYFPTHVVPSWIEHVSAALPLTYGLRALRQALLEGLPLAGFAGDLGILATFTVGLGALAMLMFRTSMSYARRHGTLAQY
jgi:ABC-type polysaccharide/polyol phosphate export permease